MNRHKVLSPASPLIARFGHPDRRKLPPVRRRQDTEGKYLICTTLSRMTGSNLSAESMIRPVLPAFTGVGEIARRFLLAGFEVAKTAGGWEVRMADLSPAT